jgi:hypothetical protein
LAIGDELLVLEIELEERLELTPDELGMAELVGLGVDFPPPPPQADKAIINMMPEANIGIIEPKWARG